MNRIFATNRMTQPSTSGKATPRLRATQRSREDVEDMLRDIAFVLAMTRRVKSEILESREFAETAMA